MAALHIAALFALLALSAGDGWGENSDSDDSDDNYSSSSSSMSPSMKNIIIWQRENDNGVITSIQYTSDVDSSPGSKYEALHGENSDPGTVGYIRGYNRAYAEVKDRGDWNLGVTGVEVVAGGYTLRLRVCELSYNTEEGNRITSFQVLSPSDCHSLKTYTNHPRSALAQEIRSLGMYVSKEPRDEENPRPFNIALCKSDNGVIFSHLSNSGSCPSGSEELARRKLYAFGGDMFCPALLAANFPNGRYEVFRKDGAVQESAIFNCEYGYALEGRNRISCGSTGHWSGDFPHCVEVDCGEPPQVSNGVWKGSGFSFNTQLQLECDHGYETDRSYNIIHCGITGSWSENAVTCIPRSCGPPASPLHGTLHGGDYTYKSVVEWSCQPTYRLDGATTAQCQADGTWSADAPRCENISCDILMQPLNGKRNGDVFDIGSIVVFSCYTGFNLVGDSDILKCEQYGDEGKWDHAAPTCSKHDCGEPVVPQSGSIVGADFTYGARVQFECEPGHIRVGATSIKCTEEGWDAESPVCQAVTCADPGTPQGGRREPTEGEFVYESQIRFSCNAGHSIIGVSVITCMENGRWSHRIPQCVAIECDVLPPVANGTRESDRSEGRTTITFKCYPGFELHGAKSTTCQDDRSWSNRSPVCRACRVGEYKSVMDEDQCMPCPPRSTTITEASSSIEHCICQQGTMKSDDGLSCEAQVCEPALSAPANGTMDDCGHAYSDTCTFDCDDGHVLRGSKQSTCQTHGWTSSVPYCERCQDNYYKESAGSLVCQPCPRNSHTNGKLGVSRESCVCRPGFQLNELGFCEDIDECADNNGGCSHECHNMLGSYRCSCTIPGYELLDDLHTCYPNKSCSENAGVPNAGNMTCRHTEASNGNICHYKCQPGYQFVSGVNNYVTCGMETDFIWSHQLVNRTARLPACTEEFFVDVRLPMSVGYTAPHLCNAVELQAAALADSVSQTLNTLAACQGRCTTQDMSTECADVADGASSVLTLSFALIVKNEHDNAVGSDCNPSCKQQNLRGILVSSHNIFKELKSLVTNGDPSMLLEDNSYEFAVKRDSVERPRPDIRCREEGQVYTKDRVCVPCDKGFYLKSRKNDVCTPCPSGSYQRFQGQTKCNLCPDGSTTISEGSYSPTQCSVDTTVVQSVSFRNRRSFDLLPQDINFDEPEEYNFEEDFE